MAGHGEHQTQRPLGRVFACAPLRTGREQPGHNEQPGHSEDRTQRTAEHNVFWAAISHAHPCVTGREQPGH
eukprot:13934164-Alexandrium_andersonii.AAC.1